MIGWKIPYIICRWRCSPGKITDKWSTFYHVWLPEAIGDPRICHWKRLHFAMHPICRGEKMYQKLYILSVCFFSCQKKTTAAKGGNNMHFPHFPQKKVDPTHLVPRCSGWILESCGLRALLPVKKVRVSWVSWRGDQLLRQMVGDYADLDGFWEIKVPYLSWLVVWNMFILPYHPNWLIFFRGVGQPPSS